VSLSPNGAITCPEFSTDTVRHPRPASPRCDANGFAQEIGRWKHLAALTQDDQENVIARSVIDRARRQIGLFTTLLLTVSSVIIGLIIYTMTIDKRKPIATLKLIGAPDWRIVGLIVQQALAIGVLSFLVGAVLINAGQGYFPRRVVLEPEDAAILFGVVLVVRLQALLACAPRSRSTPHRRSQDNHDRAARRRT
jgi:putative ABC transport system permease protein